MEPLRNRRRSTRIDAPPRDLADWRSVMANGDDVRLYLDPQSLAALDAHAAKHGLSRSALMRLMLHEAAEVLACPICWARSRDKAGNPL